MSYSSSASRSAMDQSSDSNDGGWTEPKNKRRGNNNRGGYQNGRGGRGRGRGGYDGRNPTQRTSRTSETTNSNYNQDNQDNQDGHWNQNSGSSRRGRSGQGGQNNRGGQGGQGGQNNRGGQGGRGGRGGRGRDNNNRGRGNGRHVTQSSYGYENGKRLSCLESLLKFRGEHDNQLTFDLFKQFCGDDMKRQKDAIYALIAVLHEEDCYSVFGEIFEFGFIKCDTVHSKVTKDDFSFMMKANTTIDVNLKVYPILHEWGAKIFIKNSNKRKKIWKPKDDEDLIGDTRDGEDTFQSLYWARYRNYKKDPITREIVVDNRITRDEFLLKYAAICRITPRQASEITLSILNKPKPSPTGDYVTVELIPTHVDQIRVAAIVQPEAFVKALVEKVITKPNLANFKILDIDIVSTVKMMKAIFDGRKCSTSQLQLFFEDPKHQLVPKQQFIQLILDELLGFFGETARVWHSPSEETKSRLGDDWKELLAKHKIDGVDINKLKTTELMKSEIEEVVKAVSAEKGSNPATVITIDLLKQKIKNVINTYQKTQEKNWRNVYIFLGILIREGFDIEDKFFDWLLDIKFAGFACFQQSTPSSRILFACSYLVHKKGTADDNRRLVSTVADWIKKGVTVETWAQFNICDYFEKLVLQDTKVTKFEHLVEAYATGAPNFKTVFEQEKASNEPEEEYEDDFVPSNPHTFSKNGLEDTIDDIIYTLEEGKNKADKNSLYNDICKRMVFGLFSQSHLANDVITSFLAELNNSSIAADGGMVKRIILLIVEECKERKEELVRDYPHVNKVTYSLSKNQNLKQN